MEKATKAVSGFLIVILILLVLGVSLYLFITGAGQNNPGYSIFGAILMIAFVFLYKGLMIVNPNEARVLIFFGEYAGTVKKNGLLWVNHFYRSNRISLRSENWPFSNYPKKVSFS